LKTYLDYPVATVEQNPDGERLIVLLHGFGASTFSWRTVIGQLAVLGHVIAYDRPGFGFTPLVDRAGAGYGSVSPDPYSLAGQVDLLKAVIDTEARGRDVIVVGHSAGALVTTEFVLRHPGVAKGLILESPAVWRRPPIPAGFGALMRAPFLEKFGDRLLSSFDKAGMKILKQSFYDERNLTQFIIDGYRAPMQQNTWRISLWRFMSASQQNRVRENLGNLGLPVFMITGDHDTVVKVEDTFKVTERIPGHSIYVVPNAGHLAHEERPDDFVRVVTKFIERVSPQS
jgi:pimeloyl-ACP methyl ester carboxylesterase